MKRYFIKIAISIGLLNTMPSILRAEKVVEIPITYEKWTSLKNQLPQAYFTDFTEKGIKILIEDEDLKTLERLGIPYTVVEDLTLKKKLLYNGKTLYHTYTQMVSELTQLVQSHSNIAKMDTIGYSVQGRPIVCVKISDNPTRNEPEPKVRFVGAHHGNEWISAEVPFYYAKYLMENYGTDQTVTSLVNNTEFYIIPIFNPDGHVAQTRANANGVDLNRNYGYIQNNSGTSPYSEPETRAMHEFSKGRNFNMSLSFHSGAVYVNYIWNYTPVRSADDRYNNLVQYYSQQYGNLTGYPITEGYEWYQTLGDLNDYSYGINGDIDWTIEVSSSYIPDTSQIIPIFNTNKPAMNLFAKKAGQGIGGFVIDSLTGDTIKNARITTLPVDWPIWTDKFTGDFIRPLLPGNYSIRVEAPGYIPKVIQNIQVVQDTLTWVNVYLAPRSDWKVSLWKPEVIYINASNSVLTSDTFMTHYALGEHDGKYFSLGVGGYAIFDLGMEVRSETIYVYEGVDNTPNEGFKLYVSNSPYGDWTQIGNVFYGNAVIPVSQRFRYVKIVDDGDGSSTTRKCGYDLDAIEIKVTPDVGIVAYSVQELNGNGNGIINPQETGLLNLRISNNTPNLVTNLVLKPGISDPHVQFMEDSVILMNLYGNSVKDTFFTFSTDSTLPYDYTVNMEIELKIGSYSYRSPVTFKLNQKDETVYTGPDLYGYYAYDSKDTIYSEYEFFSFFDISGLGTLISAITNNDDATTRLHLPFTFKYYSQNFDTISVCSNGWLAMGSTLVNTMNNRPIPDPNNPPRLIAPFFTDLDPYSSGDIYYYYDAPNHQFIVMWKDVEIWGTSVTVDFEVILRDPAYYPTATGDGEIIFVYGNITDNYPATVGIESPNHTTGIQCFYSGSYDNSFSRLVPGQFVKFTTDAPRVKLNEGLETRPLISLKSSILRNTLEIYSRSARFGRALLFDVNGRVLRKWELLPGQTSSLELRGLQKGIYFLRVEIPEEGFSNSFKVLKVE